MNEFSTRKNKAYSDIFSIERWHRTSNEEICASVVTLRTNLRWLVNTADCQHIAEPVKQIVRCVEDIEDALSNHQATIRDSRELLTDGIGDLEDVYVDHLRHRTASTVHAINDPAVRSAVLALTGGRCAYCDCVLEQGTGSTEAFTIEHIVPRDSGGPDNIANYVPACRSCNCSKGTGHVITFIKRRVSLAAGAKPDLRVVGTDSIGGG